MNSTIAWFNNINLFDDDYFNNIYSSEIKQIINSKSIAKNDKVIISSVSQYVKTQSYEIMEDDLLLILIKLNVENISDLDDCFYFNKCMYKKGTLHDIYILYISIIN
jgi:hypothetical protein